MKRNSTSIERVINAADAGDDGQESGDGATIPGDGAIVWIEAVSDDDVALVERGDGGDDERRDRAEQPANRANH